MHVAFFRTARWLAASCLILLTGRVAAQAPLITVNPQSQTNQVGSIVTFSTEATGEAPLTFTYYFNGTVFSTFTNGLVSFAVSSVLDAGTYLTVVTNALGSATSAPAVLTVIGPPAITVQPTNQTVFVGQTATFGVTAVSPGPATYQWFFRSVPIEGATNTTLVIPHTTIVDHAGTYQVRVSNLSGTTPSLFVVLTVDPLPEASLNLGTVTITNRIRVPVLFTAHGTETNLSFSTSFDPAVYTNATFEPDREPTPPEASVTSRVRPASLPADAIVTTDDSQLPSGRIGVAIAWATTNLAPGQSTIGQLIFDLARGATNPVAGKLGLTNVPLPAVFAPPVDEATNIVLNAMGPQFVTIGGFSLNRQTGYIQQGFTYANPGNGWIENSRLTVANLGVDSRTNSIVLANSQGTEILPLVQYVDLGAIAATEIREALLEYYVSDRVTTPNPTFDLFATPTVVIPPPRGSVLDDVVTRYTNNLVLVEFPTRADRRYYIEYATNMAGFTNGVFNTSLPPVNGSGSRRQWLDSGPPRTDSLPYDETRFYRVIEAR